MAETPITHAQTEGLAKLAEIPPVGKEDIHPCTCHPDDNPPRPCPQRFAYSECVAAASEAAAGVLYQFREIGEGEGWRDCSKSNYEYFQRDPLFDTRTVPAPSAQSLADENVRLRAALDRARNILCLMAMEHETGWRSIFARWPIHHEPLRSDARAALPFLDAALATGGARHG